MGFAGGAVAGVGIAGVGVALEKKVGCGVRRLLGILILLPALCPAKTFYVVVAGLGGEPEYVQRFEAVSGEAASSIKAAGGDNEVTWLYGKEATKTNFRSSLEQVAQAAKPSDSLVLLMIGHGSFDGTDYKFNVPGPDVTAAELAAWLDRVPASRQLVVDTTSASGAALKPLAHPGRIVVAATRDGAEKNATVFARFWVEALHDNSADTDKNDSVSAREAFDYAQRKTAKFYQEQQRIATEHPVMEDTQHANAFTVLRFGSAVAAAADPAKKALVAKRDDLEGKIDSLKQDKTSLAPEEYKKRLTQLLLDLARTQQEIDK
jgi:hypothetical protein